jgi:Prion-inhibition and propagation/Het-s 218-289
MADFGTFSGAISLAALFNNCVECFEYIQIGRHCDRDFRTCQLELDCIRSRLSRWGNAVQINRSEGPAAGPMAGSEMEEMFDILKQIYVLFGSAEKTSRRYEARTPTSNALQVFNANSDLDPVALTLHRKMQATAQKRRHKTGLLARVAWALYDRKNLEFLITGIKNLTDELEERWPAEPARRQLVSIEVEEIDDAASLTALAEAADGSDDLLRDTAREKKAALYGEQKVGSMKLSDSARARIGDEWSVEAMKAAKPGIGGSRQEVQEASASGQSNLHIGASYGGSSVFGGPRPLGN